MTFISPIWKFVDEYYICFVVVTWYLGSVVGSYAAAFLLSRRALDIVIVSCILDLCIMSDGQKMWTLFF